jgi:hypothetical protein
LLTFLHGTGLQIDSNLANQVLEYFQSGYVSMTERTDLLRNHTPVHIVNKMKTQKINLLELSDSEKTKLLKQVREYLRQQLIEDRFCRSFACAYEIKA